MPEGDTIFKLAAFLQPALRGRRLVAGHLRDNPAIDLAGSKVNDVYARGKHLFIALDQGRLLRSHLGMTGSWHHYASNEVWQRPKRQASIVLDTGTRVYVCFNARQIELLRAHGVSARKHGILLGPDLMLNKVDFDRIIERSRTLGAPTDPIADLLLDQRVACGIGNVYKSEVLFVERCHPGTPLSALDEAQLRILYERAAQLLHANRHGGPRVTRNARDDAGPLWVYGRTAQPCLNCSTPIASMRFGRDQRSTYWCPQCQAESG